MCIKTKIKFNPFKMETQNNLFSKFFSKNFTESKMVYLDMPQVPEILTHTPETMEDLEQEFQAWKEKVDDRTEGLGRFLESILEGDYSEELEEEAKRISNSLNDFSIDREGDLGTEIQRLDKFYQVLMNALDDMLILEAEEVERLTELTPAQAKKIVEQFRGVHLDLSKLTSVDTETARELAKAKSRNLDLNGITSLNAETARELAKFGGARLYLNGITSLDAETARELVKLKKGDGIFLNGLTNLDAETARELARFKGTSFDSFLSLSGVTSLDIETARELVKFKGARSIISSLNLSGLTSLDAETEEELKRFTGDIFLPNQIIERNPRKMRR